MDAVPVQPSGRITVLHGNILHAGDPLWWAEEDIRLLRGTRLGAAAEHHARQTEQLGRWRQQLCSLQAGLGGHDTLQAGCGGWAMSHEALRWAKSTVWSRAFNIPYLGLPFFLSHSFNAHALATSALLRAAAKRDTPRRELPKVISDLTHWKQMGLIDHPTSL